MEITLRGLITAMHGIFFGSLFLMAGFAVVVELFRSANEKHASQLTYNGYRLQIAYLITMAALGWAAVLSGTYLIYPWYRAAPPAATTNLAAFPRSLLLSHANTAGWHSFGMEWKEHIGWVAPIVLTALAFILIYERRSMERDTRVRNAVIGFAVAGVLSTAVAGLFGAMLDKAAPVEGGQTITLQGSAK